MIETVHGTAVALDGVGVLLRGPSGSGKSDLALRLIDQGAVLVADDRTALERDGKTVVARAPDTIAGLLEVRGIGVVRVATQASVELALAVDLAAPPERIPKPEFAAILGISIPLIRLCGLEPAAPAKIRLAVRAGPDDIVR